MTLPLSSTPPPHKEPEPVQRQATERVATPEPRPSRAKGFLNASGVERSALWMGLGLAVIAFLVVSMLGGKEPQSEQSEPASTVIDAPVIPLPEGDIGGVSEQPGP